MYTNIIIFIKQLFSFDVRNIDWPMYLESYCMGTKIYALKENISDLPKAKQALKRFLMYSYIKMLIKNIIL